MPPYHDASWITWWRLISVICAVGACRRHPRAGRSNCEASRRFILPMAVVNAFSIVAAVAVVETGFLAAARASIWQRLSLLPRFAAFSSLRCTSILVSLFANRPSPCSTASAAKESSRALPGIELEVRISINGVVRSFRTAEGLGFADFVGFDGGDEIIGFDGETTGTKSPASPRLASRLACATCVVAVALPVRRPPSSASFSRLRFFFVVACSCLALFSFVNVRAIHVSHTVNQTAFAEAYRIAGSFSLKVLPQARKKTRWRWGRHRERFARARERSPPPLCDGGDFFQTIHPEPITAEAGTVRG